MKNSLFIIIKVLKITKKLISKDISKFVIIWLDDLDYIEITYNFQAISQVMNLAHCIDTITPRF